MIEFRELRISPDGKNIIVELSIPDEYYYKNVYLDKLIIDTQDTYSAAGPHNAPIWTSPLGETVYDSNGNIVYSEPVGNLVKDSEGNSICTSENKNVYTQDGKHLFTAEKEVSYMLDEYGQLVGVKHVRLVIPASSISADINKDVLFVYATARGIPAPDTPCGYDNSIKMQVLVNLYPVYQDSIYYFNELADSCNIPHEFIDYLLKLKAFQLAVKTGNYNQAIKLWKSKTSGRTAVKVNKSRCGCHGTII